MLAAFLLTALDRHQAAGSSEWRDFLAQFGLVIAAGLPLLIAHLAACQLSGLRASSVWLFGFLLFPLGVEWIQVEEYPLVGWHWITAAGFSLVALLVSSLPSRNVLSALRRLPLTLDSAIAALVAAFVLASFSMFSSVADPINSQPFRVWFDPAQIGARPLRSLSYLLQFTFVGCLIFGFYLGCRYILIRKVLHRDGWLTFAYASLVYWILFTPLAGGLALLLPLNPDHWSVLPSENHNPFDPLNYAFSAVLWATVTPIILASERLLAERGDALGRHEQVRAELHMLHQQINPHFLFNSLNTLYALCLGDRAASAEAIVKLSDLLRYVVYDGGRDWVRLDEEIAYLRNYIDLQLLRFGNRCRVSCLWPEDASRFQIPPLLLIMLVENAFKHGVEPAEDNGVIDMELALEGTRMRFVCGNTTATPLAAACGEGVGLSNMRRRLELLFGEAFMLVSARSEASWRAELSVDLRKC